MIDFLEPIYVTFVSRIFVNCPNRGASTHHEINCLTLDVTLPPVVNNKQGMDKKIQSTSTAPIQRPMIRSNKIGCGCDGCMFLHKTWNCLVFRYRCYEKETLPLWTRLEGSLSISTFRCTALEALDIWLAATGQKRHGGLVECQRSLKPSQTC